MDSRNYGLGNKMKRKHWKMNGIDGKQEPMISIYLRLLAPRVLLRAWMCLKYD